VTDEPAFPVSPHRQGSTVDLIVSPRSSVNAIARGADGALRVSVTAPPVGGAANTAVLRLLAETLDIPRSRLSVIAGETSRRKRVLVSEMSAATLAQRLRSALRAAL
jgi:uncharacterized protein YggU (UPF0235/DUF167 family)